MTMMCILMHRLLHDTTIWLGFIVYATFVDFNQWIIDYRPRINPVKNFLSLSSFLPSTTALTMLRRDRCQPAGQHAQIISRWLQVKFHSGRLSVPRTRTNYGERSFAVQGPRTWNSLPADLRAPVISVETLRHKLKTFLFAVYCRFSTLAALRDFELYNCN